MAIVLSSQAILPSDILIACIGPRTAQTTSELLGRAPDVVADTPTMNGLVDALERHYAETARPQN